MTGAKVRSHRIRAHVRVRRIRKKIIHHSVRRFAGVHRKAK